MVQCYNKTSNEVISDALCDFGQKPVEITICQADQCPTWKTYAWGKVVVLLIGH